MQRVLFSLRWKRVCLSGAAGFALLIFSLWPQAPFIPKTYAQSSSLTLEGDAERGANFHKDLYGKPCVRFEAISRSYVSDSHIFDHIVSAENHCPQLIRLRICYKNSDRCVYVPLGAFERKESVLGVDAFKDFKYQTTETF